MTRPEDKHKKEPPEGGGADFSAADAPAPGDSKQFEDIVRAVEILVGNQNQRPGLPKKETDGDGDVIQAMDDSIAFHSEAWAVDRILDDETGEPAKMTMLDAIIRDVLPDLLKEWMDKNLEAIAVELIKRDALHDAVAKVWAKQSKNTSGN